MAYGFLMVSLHMLYICIYIYILNINNTYCVYIYYTYCIYIERENNDIYIYIHMIYICI